MHARSEILEHPDFVRGNFDKGFIDRWLKDRLPTGGMTVEARSCVDRGGGFRSAPRSSVRQCAGWGQPVENGRPETAASAGTQATKYTALAGNERIEIEVQSQTLEDVRATIEGRSYRVRLREVEPQVFWVERDDGLLALEAMKMQNEIRAAGPGQVERIAVSEGQAVNAGDLLVVLDGGSD